MELLAISDLHIGYASNREALETLPARPDDWLIVAGDVGETELHMTSMIDVLQQRFAKIIWVPGNHELWSEPRDGSLWRGEARYRRLVEICEERGVVTPESEWPLWPGAGPKTRICPLFIGYDYSFSPDGFTPDETRAWALEDGIRCTDEYYLRPDPWPSREAWCAARVAESETRLNQLDPEERLVLVAHWPLRRDLVRLFRIPRFSPWCGTRATETWHTRYSVDVVVSGHLHMRATDWRNGVRFEEVSLGYPKHWSQERGIDSYLRRILPRPTLRIAGDAGPDWHR